MKTAFSGINMLYSSMLALPIVVSTPGAAIHGGSTVKAKKGPTPLSLRKMPQKKQSSPISGPMPPEQLNSFRLYTTPGSILLEQTDTFSRL